jgi:hypothetical protein
MAHFASFASKATLESTGPTEERSGFCLRECGLGGFVGLCQLGFFGLCFFEVFLALFECFEARRLVVLPFGEVFVCGCAFGVGGRFFECCFRSGDTFSRPSQPFPFGVLNECFRCVNFAKSLLGRRGRRLGFFQRIARVFHGGELSVVDFREDPLDFRSQRFQLGQVARFQLYAWLGKRSLLWLWAGTEYGREKCGGASTPQE